MSDLSTLPQSVVKALEASPDEASLIATATRELGASEKAIALMTAAPIIDDTRVLWVNPAFVRLTGYEASAVVGQSAKILAGAHRDPIHVNEIDLVRNHPEESRFGIVARKQRPDGSWYDVEEHIVPVHLRAGAVTHHVLVQRALKP